jgi:RNA polymerase sigma-70 factor, ECF subfamily
LDEAAWIAASRAGDVQAFNRLVIAYQDSAYGLALRMLKDGDAAADATQDAFIAAFTRLHQFRGGSFKAWLLRIVLNRVYDELRKSQRHPTDSLETLGGDEDAPVLQIPSRGPGPEEAALSAELMSCIEAGLLILPTDQRAAIVLVDVQGMSYEETAEATGSSLGTVKSRVSRGRQAMRDYLSSHMELLPSSIRHYFEKIQSDQTNSAGMAADRQTES